MAHNSTIITIVTNCDVCNKPIEDDKDDFVQCDECDIEFHLKCINVSKAEAKARHNSKCLRLYCPDCMEKKENSTDEKLKTIMKMLYKLDVFNQEQKPQIAINNESISSLSSKLNVISSKLDSVSSSSSNSNNSSDSNNNSNNNNSATSRTSRQTANSYASVAKKGNVKPAVVIRPKNRQDSKKTFEDITKNVERDAVNVCGTRNVKDGGIVLRCVNATLLTLNFRN